MREQMQTPHFPTEKVAYDALTATVRAGLGAAADEVWRQGAALNTSLFAGCSAAIWMGAFR